MGWREVVLGGPLICHHQQNGVEGGLGRPGWAGRGLWMSGGWERALGGICGVLRSTRSVVGEKTIPATHVAEAAPAEPNQRRRALGPAEPVAPCRCRSLFAPSARLAFTVRRNAPPACVERVEALGATNYLAG